jgi:hypothetical protein
MWSREKVKYRTFHVIKPMGILIMKYLKNYQMKLDGTSGEYNMHGRGR